MRATPFIQWCYTEPMSETANDAAVTTGAFGTSADSIAATKPRGRGFKPGHDPRRNMAGRPRKVDTVLDLTLRELHKRRKGEPTKGQQAAVAQVERMLRRDQVGNRAFEAIVPYESGLPKQTFVMERGVDPLAELYAKIAANGGAFLPDVVEGESQVID
jgi:hypothetical protein